MFSARLGFMRPDSVTIPDGPVLPPDNPSVTGNMWFSTRRNVSYLSAYTRFEDNPFNNIITGNWMMATIVYAPTNQPGFAYLNGLDVSEFRGGNAGIDLSKTISIPVNQPVFDRLCIGAFENQSGATQKSHIGTPMYVRDFYINNGVTSLADVQKIEGWMCHDAGLEDILQYDHPYRSSSPSGFTPSDLSPRAWWHSETNFDPTGTATWSTVDGAHTLTKQTGLTNNENIQSAVEDGVNTIHFPNSMTTNTPNVFFGTKYRADSVAQGSNIHTLGVTICVLFKIYDLPGLWDKDNINGRNTSFFTFNSSNKNDSYLNGGYRPDTFTVSQFGIDDPDSDTFDESGNTDVDVANVTTDGGNVSV
jgi:hypothetical protein